MGLVFDDVVGIVEMINCKDVKIQVWLFYFILFCFFSLFVTFHEITEWFLLPRHSSALCSFSAEDLYIFHELCLLFM